MQMLSTCASTQAKIFPTKHYLYYRDKLFRIFRHLELDQQFSETEPYHGVRSSTLCFIAPHILTSLRSPLTSIIVACLTTIHLASAAAIEPRAAKLLTYSEEEMDALMASRNITWPPTEENTLHRRIGNGDRPPPKCNVQTSLVGDGDPHQAYWHQQVSQNFDCGDGECSVSHVDSKVVGWTADVGFAQWISGGFSVQESTSTGNAYGCDAKESNEEVCVWWSVAHTAYTVFNHWLPSCGGIDNSNYILKSPNKNNAGGHGYCVRGKKYCRSIDSGYWDDGRAGGP